MTNEGASEGPTCDSCGRGAQDLEPVHRIYVTPEAWDTEARAEVVGEIEHWCFSCRSQYPHQELAGEP